MARHSTGRGKRQQSEGAKDNMQSHQRDLRGEIAYRAARMIAEDGITDFAAAKQKAARQINVTKSGSLPDNHEIDVALRAHQSLFQGDSQPQECHALRQVAADVMRWLDRFSPSLVGGVLSGSANRFSQIELEIVADDAKQLEMFFFNVGMPFEIRVERAPQTQRRFTMNEISIYELSFDQIPVVIALYPNHAVRVAHHSRANQAHARAQLEDVESLLTQ